LTDEDLIRKCLKGDAAAQRQLFEQFAPRMMTVCRRYMPVRQEAEDILQEAFIRVFKSLHQFRSEGSLEGWMRKAFVRVAINHIKRSKMRFDHIDSAEVAGHDDVVSEMGAEEILSLVQQLPVGYRTIFNLNVVEGYSHEEIGQLLGIAAVTSRTQLMRAKQMLQQKINQLNKVQ
jgi:RNA polymerase sigma factor (sigma-70 family)